MRRYLSRIETERVRAGVSCSSVPELDVGHALLARLPQVELAGVEPGERRVPPLFLGAVLALLRDLDVSKIVLRLELPKALVGLRRRLHVARRAKDACEPVERFAHLRIDLERLRSEERRGGKISRYWTCP